MRLGILITSIGNFGQNGFYNAQEIGLAKALSKFVDRVDIYKSVSYTENKSSENIQGCENVIIHFVPTNNYGINGLINCENFDTSLDVLIYFSDTQFSVPKVYKWARENNVKFFPYIGVAESHSTSRMKKLFVDWMFKRNLKVYKQCQCFVKTPAVQSELAKLGVKNTTITPVGLDLTLLRPDYEDYDPLVFKKKYGYVDGDKVVLFIGRLIEEKQPLRMIEIFSEVYKRDSSYRLLMVGSGELKEQVLDLIKESGLTDKVQLIEKIPNKDIWELYRFAECFINLNEQEIFGMAILEAMYYGCKVIANKAPGPDYIIENGVSGWLVNSNREIIDKLFDDTHLYKEAHKRILENFTWQSSAKIILNML